MAPIAAEPGRNRGISPFALRSVIALLLVIAGLLNLIPALLTVPYKVGTLVADPVAQRPLAILVERTGWPQMVLWFSVAVLYLASAWRVAVGRRTLALSVAALGLDLVNYALVWTSGVYAEFRGTTGLWQDSFLYACALGGVCGAAMIEGRWARTRQDPAVTAPPAA